MQRIGGRTYLLVDDGSHIHVIGWRTGQVLYWVTNTLLEELSNAQMIAIAKSAADAALTRRLAGVAASRARVDSASRGRLRARVTGSVSTCTGVARLIERGVDERVGVRVLRARDGADRPALEARAAPPSPRGAAGASRRA